MDEIFLDAPDLLALELKRAFSEPSRAWRQKYRNAWLAAT
jgi:hypothetical protein